MATTKSYETLNITLRPSHVDLVAITARDVELSNFKACRCPRNPLQLNVGCVLVSTLKMPIFSLKNASLFFLLPSFLKKKTLLNCSLIYNFYFQRNDIFIVMEDENI